MEQPKTRHAHARELLLLVSWFLPLLMGAASKGQASADSAPQDVSGTVLDGVSNQPISRALVRLGSRATFTDAEGHFSFAAADPSALNISAVKPGYTFAQNYNDPNELTLRAEALAAPIQLRLYPEAIVKGTVLDADGHPIPDVSIEGRRSLVDEGGRRWVTAAITRSNAHGQFRLPLRAGEYCLETGFARSASDEAILPAVIPQPSSGGVEALEVHSGDQLNLDLHPATVPLLEVTARVENAAVREMNLLTAIAANGTTFPVPFTQVEAAGGTAEIKLRFPAGTYTLQARRHNFGADGLDQAVISVNAAQAQPIPVTLHFVPVSSIPVEVRVDDDAASAASSSGQALTVPNARALGLSLEPSGSSPSLHSEPLRLTQNADGTTSFAAPAGTYRLRARPGHAWYIRAATFGGTDLLSHDLVAASAAGATPIQVVVSNQTASLHGLVTLDGKPAACWLYLLPSSPSATPFYTLRSAVDGSFIDAYLPPGSYRAIAFETRHTLDPDDPRSLAAYASHFGAVTIQPGDQSNLTLEAVPTSELSR
jgi:hypothetical protein